MHKLHLMLKFIKKNTLILCKVMQMCNLTFYKSFLQYAPKCAYYKDANLWRKILQIAEAYIKV